MSGPVTLWRLESQQIFWSLLDPAFFFNKKKDPAWIIKGHDGDR